jgi:DNA-binding HxlR family transcriptional regulator/response regulator of citrate/malate metabolism
MTYLIAWDFKTQSMNPEKLSWKQRAEIISDALDPLSKKWHSKIISFLLRKDTASFTDLRENMEGISNKVLSNSLSELQSKKIVQKTDEGDNRYSLTDKGKDLSPVFDELAEWGENYLREDKKEILIIEDNKAQAKMYKRWLEPKYSAKIANTFDEALEEYSKTENVILLDRRLEDSEAEEIIESLADIEEQNIVVITGMEPDVDLLDMPIKDYLIKPIGREDLRDSVRKVLEADRGTEKHKELLELLSKKRVLDEKPTEVRQKREYQNLVERIEQLQEELKNSSNSEFDEF